VNSLDALDKFEYRKSYKQAYLKRPKNPAIVVPPPLKAAKPGTFNLVVMLHDLTGYSYVFHELGTYLLNEGFSVLDFDFYGHGESIWSENPSECDMDLYLEQTVELLTYLGFIIDESEITLPDGSLKQPLFTFHMLGFDMGSAVAASFTDIFQNSVGFLCSTTEFYCLFRNWH